MEAQCEHFGVVDSDGNRIGWVHSADYVIVIKSRWYLDRLTGYVRRSRDGMYMHRLVMGLGQKSKFRHKIVDHINGERAFNCRVCNLRVCSASENARNKRLNWKERKTSCYKGVKYELGRKGRTLSKPWRAQIRVEKAVIHLGYFATERQAAIAYNQAAERWHGLYAWPNELEPEPVEQPEPETTPVTTPWVEELPDEEEREYWRARVAEWEAEEASRFLFDPYASVDRYQEAA